MADAAASMTSAWIGLGSNLGRPQEQLESACEMLADVPGTELLRCSSWYRSAPMGPVEQPDYLNGVAELHTLLEPEALLDTLQAIEKAHDREREVRWGPRTLDLDLLLYGSRRIDTPRLTVPHPGIRERNFVLYPLRELEPGLEIPGLGKVDALARQVGDEGLNRLGSRQSE